MNQLATTAVDASFPEAYEPLFGKYRYKVYYGGRGSAKSWNFARALLLQASQRPLRILCARELQNSIRDSVHKLLCDQIDMMGLNNHYEIQQANIKSSCGSEFSFEGIRHNVSKIKSYEGIDICWVEEAQSTSKTSWEVLIPTIRKPDSEIWVSFNPELETDDTFQRFVKHATPDMLVRFVSWRDNPWFPQVLRDEMESLKARDYDDYLHVWEGQCRQVLEGAVYADELRQAQLDKRLTKVPYDQTKPVYTFWDLGYSDMTSIWFAQIVGFEFRVIDYYQNRLKSLEHYLTYLQSRSYVYDTDWLPHDAQAKSLGTGRSIQELMKEKGRKVKIVPRLSLADGINVARTIFPSCYFDVERCEEGIQSLRHYRYEVIENTGSLSRQPRHDWASHGADAFRYLAIALRQPKPNTSEALIAALRPKGLALAKSILPKSSSLGWMR